ncbi:MAG: N-acetylneuraminate synthase family protein, partial [Candidatus Omnitrophica bacterium]|nr:N-acetylneuraminate synthase family protein [Candidatus Omnitrophota bacterium]
MSASLFDKLFIFEIANNHMGSVAHGLKIIREVGQVSTEFDFKFAFKLQYRNLNTFIHPDFKGRKDFKYVRRFEETRLNEKKLKALKDEIKNLGFISICTPFDEDSVSLIEKHEFDMIKIGSCSFNDWPLIERIVKTDKPVILSTGGVSVEDIDKAVAFFEHRKKTFCLLHCVSEYPTSRENLQLNQIDFMRQRYPDIPIGFSTHEEPDNLDAIKMAIAKGATVFERHVGIESQNYKLNKYSSNPEQIRQWLSAAKDAFQLCGVSGKFRQVSERERQELRELKRGVFAARNIKKGERLDISNVFFAIPNIKNQLVASDFSKYTEFVSLRQINKDEPIILADVEVRNLRDRVLEIMYEVRKLIMDSRTSLPPKADLELSHHYG